MSTKRLVAVTWPDGHTELFEFMPKNEYLVTAFIMTPTFTPLYGATSTLRVDPDWEQTGWMDWANGKIWGGWFATDGIYDPQRYELEDKYGNKYLIGVGDEGLVKVGDRFGNTIEVTDEGLIVSNGPDLLWTRSVGVITRLDLPDGKRILYGLNTSNELTTVTYQDDSIAEYTYIEPHLLTSYAEAGHPPFAVIGYDGEGRRTTEASGAGSLVSHEWDLAGGILISDGPDIRLRTLTSFDKDGRLSGLDLQYSDSTNAPTTLSYRYQYDSRGNLTAKHHPDGAIEESRYDHNNNLAFIRLRDGIAREYTYGPFYQVAEIRQEAHVVQSVEFDLPEPVNGLRHGGDSFI